METTSQRILARIPEAQIDKAFTNPHFKYEFVFFRYKGGFFMSDGEGISELMDNPDFPIVDIDLDFDDALDVIAEDFGGEAVKALQDRWDELIRIPPSNNPMEAE